jgi:hypothetical protein
MIDLIFHNGGRTVRASHTVLKPALGGHASLQTAIEYALVDFIQNVYANIDRSYITKPKAKPSPTHESVGLRPNF